MTKISLFFLVKTLLKEYEAKDINRVWYSLFREDNSSKVHPTPIVNSPTQVDLYHVDEAIKATAIKLFNCQNFQKAKETFQTNPKTHYLKKFSG